FVFNTTVSMADPPDDTIRSAVSDRVAPEAVPPNRVSVASTPAPLPINRSPTVTPPLETTWLPPPWMVVLLPMPPARTFIRPPLLSVAPLATPPDETVSAPLLPGLP